MKRSSTALWHGTGKQGEGIVTVQSRALVHAHFAYDTRFENAKGTNPEELIAAAHASCYSMKLSFILGDAGYSVDSIEVTCTVTLRGSNITHSHLDVKAVVPNISIEKFEECANKAKEECPVSKALNVTITMDASVTSELAHDAHITI